MTEKANVIPIKRVPLDEVEPWEKNPRGIKKADFERLKGQLLKLGVYKPLVVYQEDGKYIVLGGNMRLRALRELGIKEVAVSIVKPKSEAAKLEYSLSDNDRAGYYEGDKLAELAFPLMEELNLDEWKIDLSEPWKLGDILEQFGPTPSGAAGASFDPASLPEQPAEALEFLAGFEHVFVEYSGGKDSLLALLWTKTACEKLGKPWEARFVETGAEFPDLASYLIRLSFDIGFPLRIMHPKHHIVQYYLKKGTFPDNKFHDCQHKFINEVLDETGTPPDKTIKIRGGRPEQRAGTTPKMAHTVNGVGFHLFAPYYDMPLAEYQQLIESVRPILWPGYAKGFKRTACWMCPFQTPEQWDAMKEFYPILWEEMRVLVMRLKYPRHAGDSSIRRFWGYWNKFR